MSLVYGLCWLCLYSVFREQEERKPLTQPEKDTKTTVELSPEFNCSHTHPRNPDFQLKGKHQSVFVGAFDLDGKMLNNQCSHFCLLEKSPKNFYIPN